MHTLAIHQQINYSNSNIKGVIKLKLVCGCGNLHQRINPPTPRLRWARKSTLLQLVKFKLKFKNKKGYQVQAQAQVQVQVRPETYSNQPINASTHQPYCNLKIQKQTQIQKGVIKLKSKCKPAGRRRVQVYCT